MRSLIHYYLIVIDCYSLPDIENGNLMYSYGTVFDSIAVYYCDLGYALNGSDVRYCQVNGEWNGTEPACRSE